MTQRFIHRLSGFSALVLAAAIIPGCGGPAAGEATPPAPAKPPTRLPAATYYLPGEIMSFRVMVENIEVGNGTLAAGDPGRIDGRSTIIVRSRVATTGVGALIKKVDDDVRTWIDMETGAPTRNEANLLFGHKHMLTDTRFGPRRILVNYERDTDTRKPEIKPRKGVRVFNMPSGEHAHDSHTILGALRAWKPAPGERTYFYGLAGRRMWMGGFDFKGHETIRTAMGLYPALRYEGVAARLTSGLSPDKNKKPRSYTVWLSDDVNRLPLLLTARTEYGTVRVEMTDYQRER